MNFKETFLKLTEFTIPFGHETDIEHLLPSGYKKDSIGNYYYQIGKSETLFTTHLDTHCVEKQKVNHVIEGNLIKTDGTTILGGDNKAGCVILFYLMEKMVPGTYYFFLGEEGSVHKNMPHGSLYALQANPEFFSKFKRLISFDRKEKGQLVTRQLGKNCCSNEFADALINEYKSQGVEYHKDPTGYYTDGAFFNQSISEIVNLSAGVYNEHTKSEYIDIAYTEAVAKASANVSWESLPAVRELTNHQIDPREDMDEIDLSSDQQLFAEVFDVLNEMYFVSHEIRNYNSFIYHFKPGRIYNFTKWHEDFDIQVSVKEGKIICNNITYNNIDEFKLALGIEKLSRKNMLKTVIDTFKKKGNKLTMAEFDTLVYQKSGNLKKLSKDLKRNRLKIVSTGKGYQLVKESLILNYEGFKSKKKIKNIGNYILV